MHEAQIPYWQLWRDLGAPETREIEPVLTRWLEQHGPEEQRFLGAIRDSGPDERCPLTTSGACTRSHACPMS